MYIRNSLPCSFNAFLVSVGEDLISFKLEQTVKLTSQQEKKMKIVFATVLVLILLSVWHRPLKTMVSLIQKHSQLLKIHPINPVTQKTAQVTTHQKIPLCQI